MLSTPTTADGGGSGDDHGDSLHTALNEGGPPLAERLAAICAAPLEKTWQKDVRTALVQSLCSVDAELVQACEALEAAATKFHDLGRQEQKLQLQYCEARLEEDVLPALYPLHQLEKAVATLPAEDRRCFNVLYDDNQAVALQADAESRPDFTTAAAAALMTKGARLQAGKLPPRPGQSSRAE